MRSMKEAKGALLQEMTCCAESRIPYQELQENKAKPYILGGEQRPACKQCHSDDITARMCHYLSDGPLCPKSDQQQLLRILVDRYGVQLMKGSCPC